MNRVRHRASDVRSHTLMPAAVYLRIVLSLRILGIRLGLDVLVSAPGLDREVQWAHVTELPDPRPYLSAHELVLTNGMWTPLCSADDFVRRLCDHAAAGLGFGLREGVDRPPADLLAACERHGLTLLTIPPQMPFTAITQEIAAALRDELHEPLLDAVRRSDELTAAVSGGDGLRRIVALISRTQQVPAALVDRFGHVLAAAGVSLNDDGAMQVVRALGSGRRTSQITLGDSLAAVIVVEGFGQPELAFLYLRPIDEISHAEFANLEQALRFVAIELTRIRAVRSVELRFAEELFDLILQQPHRDTELAARLRSFDIDAGAPMTAILVRTSVSQQARSAIAVHLSDYLASKGLPAAVFTHGEDIVAIFGVNTEEFSARQHADQVYDELLREVAGSGITIGAGSVAGDYRGLRTRLIQAREGARIAASQRTGRRVVSYEDITSHRLLLALLDDGSKQEFAARVLAVIFAHDQERSTQLVESLRMYFARGESLINAANGLHVHVNTLRGRLHRVEQITGRDLRKVDDRTDLLLALEISASR